MEYLDYALPLVIIAIALAVWLVIHRMYKRNIRGQGDGLFEHERDLALLEKSASLTPQERRQLRMTIAKRVREARGKGPSPGRESPIDIRQLQDKQGPGDH